MFLSTRKKNKIRKMYKMIYLFIHAGKKHNEINKKQTEKYSIDSTS